MTKNSLFSLTIKALFNLGIKLFLIVLLFLTLYLFFVRVAVITLPLYKQSLLPAINQSEYLQLEIDGWNISDNRLFPEIIINNALITTTDTEQTTFEVNVKNIKGRVDLLNSLQNLQLVFTKLEAMDASINVNIKKSKGSFNSQGIIDFVSWIEKQGDVSLDNISWAVHNEEKTLSKENWSFLWQKLDERKYAVLKDGDNQQVIRAKYFGSVNDRETITGQSYFSYDVTELLSLLPATGISQVKNKAHVSGWVKSFKGNIQLIAQPDIDAVSLTVQNNVIDIENLKGLQFANLSNAADLKIQWRDVSFKLNEQVLELNGLTEVNLNNKSIKRVYIEQLQLKALAEVAKNYVNTTTVSTLEALQPTATIKNIHVLGDWSELSGLGVVFDLENLSARLNEETLLDKLSGRVFLQKEQSTIVMDSKDAVFSGAIFDKPLKLSADGVLRVTKSDDDIMRVSSNQIHAFNDEVDADIVFAIDTEMPSKKSNLSLDITLNRLQGKAAANYIPFGVMPKTSAPFLRRAFVDGNVDSGKILFEGDPQSWKNKSPKPKLMVAMWSNDMVLNVSPSWPVMEDVKALVVVNNNTTDVYLESATLSKMSVGESHINVTFTPEIGSVVTVPETQVTGDASQLWNLFNQSAFMKKRIPQSVRSWQAVGDISGRFAMRLPLRDVNALDLTVKTQFMQNHITMDNPKIVMSNVSGDLSFTMDEGLKTNNMRADMWQGNANIGIDMSVRPFALDIVADVAALDTQSVLADFNLQQLPIDGLANALINLSVPYGGAPLDISVSSPMHMVTIDLPPPFNKTKGYDVPHTIDIYQRADVMQVNVYNGEHNVALQHKGGDVDAVHVSLSALRKKVQKLTPGFYIDGNIEQFSIPEWKAFVDSPSDKGQSSPQSGAPQKNNSMISRIKEKPFKLDVSFKALEVTESLVLSDAELVVNNANDNWSAAISSDKLAGVLSSPLSLIDSEKVLLEVNLSKLHLDTVIPSAEITGVSEPYDLQHWHDANVNINELYVNKTKMGNIGFALRNKNNAISLDNVKGTIAGFAIDATGSWKSDNGIMLNSLDGVAKASDLSQISRALGKPVFGKEGATSVEYKLFWPGLLQDFSLKDATGSIYFKSEAGRFVEVENYAALRILGVFNIANWQRRLRLDFEDLYQEGLLFDSIEGTFRLSKGSINTAYFNILGPSSQILMSGDINLNANTLDMNAEVVLPISKTLYAGCLIGLPACAGFFAVERAFGGGIEKAAAVNYDLSGSFMKPQFKRKENKKAKVTTSNPVRKPSAKEQTSSEEPSE